MHISLMFYMCILECIYVCIFVEYPRTATKKAKVSLRRLWRYCIYINTYICVYGVCRHIYIYKGESLPAAAMDVLYVHVHMFMYIRSV